MTEWDGHESSCSCDCGFDIPRGGTLDELFVRNIHGIAKLIYPVGSIYMSMNPTEPSILFGGTWEKIEGRFLLAADSTYPVETTGGTTEHQHVSPGGVNAANNHPGISYRHGSTEVTVNASFSALDSAMTNGSGSYKWKLPKTDTVSHMPPYMAVHMWRRLKDPTPANYTNLIDSDGKTLIDANLDEFMVEVE